jgi:hypothetical protein
VAAGCALGNSLRASANSGDCAGSMPPAWALTGIFSCRFASSGMHTSEHTSQLALAASESGAPAFKSFGAVICTKCTACLA